MKWSRLWLATYTRWYILYRKLKETKNSIPTEINLHDYFWDIYTHISHGLFHRPECYCLCDMYLQ